MCKQERKDPAGNRIWDALDHNRTYMIILDMYLTMLSVILGGILNMLFVKSINIRLTVTENSGTGKGYLETIKHG